MIVQLNYNFLFISLFLIALPIKADDSLVTTFTPRIVITNENSDIVIKDVKGLMVDYFEMPISADNINIAIGNFDGGSDDIAVSVSEQLLFYKLDGTKGSKYSVGQIGDIAAGNIDGDGFAEFFMVAANDNSLSIYDGDAKLLNRFNINGLDENAKISITTADIDGQVEKIIVATADQNVVIFQNIRM